jgi:hypothetical protein
MTVGMSGASAAGSGVPVLYCHPVALPWVTAMLSTSRMTVDVRQCLAPPAQASGPLLWASAGHLELRLQQGREAGAWIRVDEVLRRAGQSSELLKACGLRSPALPESRKSAARAALTRPRILDAMGGWGLDGLLLAAAGAHVTLVEREPLLHLLELDLVRRAEARDIEPQLGDGFDLLVPARDFDVIYLDPMFPTRNKRALPGKSMQYLAALLTGSSGGSGVERSLDRWIAQAVPAARQRVVMKRRLHDPLVATPDWQIRGRTIRYDVFRGRAVSARVEQRDESRRR